MKGLGRRGEDAAARYLRKRGYKLINRNLRLAGVEVDLVAELGEWICFVEVKSRSRDDHGDPLEFVDPPKQRRLIRAARVFCAGRPWRDRPVRFDVISVLERGEKLEVHHLEDAFQEE